MRIEANFDEINDSFSHPPGWYPVRIVSAEDREGKTKDGDDYEMVLFRAEITEGEHAGDSVYFTSWISRGNEIDKRGIKWFKRLLKAAGIKWDPDGVDTEDLVGCELEVYIDNEPEDKDDPESELRDVVRRYRPL